MVMCLALSHCLAVFLFCLYSLHATDLQVSTDEVGIDNLSRNVGKQLPLLAA